jgi:hypothetical protein
MVNEPTFDSWVGVTVVPEILMRYRKFGPANTCPSVPEALKNIGDDAFID